MFVLAASDSWKLLNDRDLFCLRRALSFLFSNFSSKSLLFFTADVLLLFLNDIKVEWFLLDFFLTSVEGDLGEFRPNASDLYILCKTLQ